MKQNKQVIAKINKNYTRIFCHCRLFRIMDDDGSRNLNQEEFLHGLKEVGLELSEDDTKEIFQKFDTNGDGSINIEEFLIHIRVSIYQLSLV